MSLYLSAEQLQTGKSTLEILVIAAYYLVFVGVYLERDSFDKDVQSVGRRALVLGLGAEVVLSMLTFAVDTIFTQEFSLVLQRSGQHVKVIGTTRDEMGEFDALTPSVDSGYDALAGVLVQAGFDVGCSVVPNMPGSGRLLRRHATSKPPLITPEAVDEVSGGVDLSPEALRSTSDLATKGPEWNSVGLRVDGSGIAATSVSPNDDGTRE